MIDASVQVDPNFRIKLEEVRQSLLDLYRQVPRWDYSFSRMTSLVSGPPHLVSIQRERAPSFLRQGQTRFRPNSTGHD